MDSLNLEIIDWNSNCSLSPTWEIKITNVKGERLRVGTLGVDPHGEIVCLYEQERCQFILIQVNSIFKHFQHYRISYFQNNCYDNKERLPHLLMFKSEQILQGFPTIKLSTKLQGCQFIIIYFCTLIEIVKVDVERWQIVFRVLSKLSSEILEVNVIGLNVYISLYDGSMMNLELEGIQRRKRSEVCRRIVQVTQGIKNSSMLQSVRIDEDIQQGYKIWQTYSGKLMLNRTVISSEFEDNFDYSNSFEEYLGKQVNEKHPIKYEMSVCRQYIIGSSFGKIVSPIGHYSLKARWGGWAQVFQCNIKPEINQYWRAYQSYMQKEQNWGFRKPCTSTTPKKSYLCDKLLIGYYSCQNHILTICWLVVSKQGRKRVGNTEGQAEERRKYKSEEKIILCAKNLKSPVVQMRWIGLNQMLFVDKSFKLYFLQFDEQQLTK